MVSSRTISPLWSSVIATSFVSAIALFAMQKSDVEHEPVTIKTPDTSLSLSLLQVASVSTPVEATPLKEVMQDIAAASTTVTSEIGKEPWRYVMGSETNDVCGGIKDPTIEEARKTTSSLLIMSEPARGVDQSSLVRYWLQGHKAVQDMRAKFGEKADACVHPTLFAGVDKNDYRQKLYTLVGVDMAIAANTSASLDDRFKAWERTFGVLYTDISTNMRHDDNRQALFNHLGYTQDKFIELGNAITQPLVNQLLNDVTEAMKRPASSYTAEQLNGLVQKGSYAAGVNQMGAQDPRVNEIYANLRDYADGKQRVTIDNSGRNASAPQGPQ